MELFDGKALAQQMVVSLQPRVKALKERGQRLSIAAILFTEDAGSQLYTRLKKNIATQLDIEYIVYSFSMNSSSGELKILLEELNKNSQITGIIIQKPWTQRWQEVTSKSRAEFQDWWASLVSQIAESKDVDGLHPQTMLAIKEGTWAAQKKVLPATAQAVMTIFKTANLLQSAKKFVIIGKSDLLGTPLFYELSHQHLNVELLGKQQLTSRIEDRKFLSDADVIVSATGQFHLITGEMITPGAALIDAGEPKPDIDQQSVASKASFLTPVPGGVGPLTVVCLMQNVVTLAGG